MVNQTRSNVSSPADSTSNVSKIPAETTYPVTVTPRDEYAEGGPPAAQPTAVEKQETAFNVELAVTRAVPPAAGVGWAMEDLETGPAATSVDEEMPAISAQDGSPPMPASSTASDMPVQSVPQRQIGDLPQAPTDQTELEQIWTDQVQYHDVRSVLSQIWARDETVLHSILSEIWARPAVRAVLSEIWEEAVEVVEPRGVLSGIWAEPAVHVDIRSVLSQIWSDDNKQRLMSILSEIWNTPAVRSILSEIWGSGPVRSILGDIWTVPIEKIDIRSVLSQIWSTEHDEPRPKSILSEIWATPAVQGVLSEIWGSPKLGSLLSEIWREPVEKIDIRSILSRIWSTDNDDEHVRSILSEIWSAPAVRSVLSQIWRAEEEVQVVDTRADYRVTESELLLEELIENLQRSEPDVTPARSRAGADEPLGEEEREERSKHRVHRYTAAADEGDLPASRPLVRLSA